MVSDNIRRLARMGSPELAEQTIRISDGVHSETFNLATTEHSVHQRLAVELILKSHIGDFASDAAAYEFCRECAWAAIREDLEVLRRLADRLERLGKTPSQ